MKNFDCISLCRRPSTLSLQFFSSFFFCCSRAFLSYDFFFFIMDFFSAIFSSSFFSFISLLLAAFVVAFGTNSAAERTRILRRTFACEFCWSSQWGEWEGGRGQISLVEGLSLLHSITYDFYYTIFPTLRQVSTLFLCCLLSVIFPFSHVRLSSFHTSHMCRTFLLLRTVAAAVCCFHRKLDQWYYNCNRRAWTAANRADDLDVEEKKTLDS